MRLQFHIRLATLRKKLLKISTIWSVDHLSVLSLEETRGVQAAVHYKMSELVRPAQVSKFCTQQTFDIVVTHRTTGQACPSSQPAVQGEEGSY